MVTAVNRIPGQVKHAASSLPELKVQKGDTIGIGNFIMKTSASEKQVIKIIIRCGRLVLIFHVWICSFISRE